MQISLSTLSKDLQTRIRKEILSSSRPVIVVDVQPAYADFNSNVCEAVVEFVAKQTGQTLLLINADDQGMTDDTKASVIDWWNEIASEYGLELDWSKIQIFDKGYGYLRSWMDTGINEEVILETIREMHKHDVTDSRDLELPPVPQRSSIEQEIAEAIEAMDGDPLHTGWLELPLMHSFNNAYLVGGADNECLSEVELMLRAFKIKYERIEKLIY